MNRSTQILSLITFMLLTACAPIVYEPAPQAYYSPSADYYGHAEYGYPGAYTYVPIEVALYAGYGAYLQTIVIRDREYVEVPIRTRAGRVKHVFAHYQHGDLHFDSDRYCNNIQDAPWFRYEKSWEKGRRYEHVNNRDDFLGGLSVTIRNKIIQRDRSGLSHDQRTQRREDSRFAGPDNVDKQKTYSNRRSTRVYEETNRGQRLTGQDNRFNSVQTAKPAVQVIKKTRSGEPGGAYVVNRVVVDKRNSAADLRKNQGGAARKAKSAVSKQKVKSKQKAERDAAGDIVANVDEGRATFIQRLKGAGFMAGR